MATSQCPCGSNRPREQCCGPFLDGLRDPDTAEQLMRARYSAYTEARGDFLTETLVEKQKANFDGDQAAQFGREASWLGLHIFETTGGGPDDETGTVTFEARYVAQGRESVLRERSRFRREEGRWLYVDGDVAGSPRAGRKVGRNEPCPCGSGKKYKKCCGRTGGAS